MAEHVYDFGKAGGEGKSDWMSLTIFEIGTLVSSIAGIGAVVSAIMGLIGLSPEVLGAVAAISAGTAMLTEGAANAAGIARKAHSDSMDSYAEKGGASKGIGRQDLEIAGGFGLQAFTGLAAIIMGIISLLGYNPGVLACVSAMAMGAGLIATGISLVRREPGVSRPRTLAAHAHFPALHHSNGAVELMVGIAAGVLGILGLAAGYTLTFALIAMLALGAAIFFNGTSMAGKLFRAAD